MYQNLHLVQQQQCNRLLIWIKDLKGKYFRYGKKTNECEAIKSTFRKCHKLGHLSRVCLQMHDSTSDINVDSAANINLMKSEISEKYVHREYKTVQKEFDSDTILSFKSLKQFRTLNLPNKLRTYTGEIINEL